VNRKGGSAPSDAEGLDLVEGLDQFVAAHQFDRCWQGAAIDRVAAQEGAEFDNRELIPEAGEVGVGAYRNGFGLARGCEFLLPRHRRSSCGCSFGLDRLGGGELGRELAYQLAETGDRLEQAQLVSLRLVVLVVMSFVAVVTFVVVVVMAVGQTTT